MINTLKMPLYCLDHSNPLRWKPLQLHRGPGILCFTQISPWAPDHTDWPMGTQNSTHLVFILFPKATTFSVFLLFHQLKFLKFSKRSSLLAFTLSSYCFYNWSDLWLFCGRPQLIFPNQLKHLFFHESTNECSRMHTLIEVWGVAYSIIEL